MSACTRKQTPQIDGRVVFEQKCLSCHQADNDLRAPEPEALQRMTRASIRASLLTGAMRWEGKRLSKAEKDAVVNYLGKADVPPVPAIAACARDLDPPPNPPVWTNWGVDVHNTRFQSAPSARLDRDNVQKLTLRWAFAFPGAYATYGQPTTSAGRVFVGSEDGTVYSLDAATGCM